MPTASIHCLTCRRAARRLRGCCDACYKRHTKAIRQQLTTWEKLQAEGLAASPTPTGQQWRRWFPAKMLSPAKK